MKSFKKFINEATINPKSLKRIKGVFNGFKFNEFEKGAVAGVEEGLEKEFTVEMNITITPLSKDGRSVKDIKSDISKHLKKNNINHQYLHEPKLNSKTNNNKFVINAFV